MTTEQVNRENICGECGAFKRLVVDKSLECSGHDTENTPAPSEDVPQVPCWCNGIGKTHQGPEDSDPHQRNCFYKREGYRAALAQSQARVRELEGLLREVGIDQSLRRCNQCKADVLREEHKRECIIGKLLTATANEGVK